MVVSPLLTVTWSPLYGGADGAERRWGLRGFVDCALACYLVVQTIITLALDVHPAHSPLGIG